MALAGASEAELEPPPTSFASVCVDAAIWVSSPSESNCANSTVNWLGSTGSSGLWFCSCTDNSCKNVWVKSTPGSVDEDTDEDEAEEFVVDDEFADGAAAL